MRIYSLAALRCLLEFPADGVVKWKTDPVKFFDRFGSDLVGRLFDEYMKLGRNPGSVGKNRSVYEGLYEKAENLYGKAKSELDAAAAA